MDCKQARLALSAELDGESPGVGAELLRGHLERCAACQQWQDQAVSVTRRLQLSSATPSADLFEQIVLQTRPQLPKRWLRRFRIAALLLCAAGQVAISVPDLAGHGDHGMAAHGMHEIAVFGLALAFAFVTGAVRPRLAAGLSWMAGAVAVGLVVTALSDIIGARTFGTHEAQHLIAISGALLLVWTARGQRDPDSSPLAFALRPVRREAAHDEPYALDQDDAA